ncbi:conserved protein, unknown function, partial [Hepatocystis sp. ex Piliocolobus tephrosceles]
NFERKKTNDKHVLKKLHKNIDNKYDHYIESNKHNEYNEHNKHDEHNKHNKHNKKKKKKHFKNLNKDIKHYNNILEIAQKKKIFKKNVKLFLLDFESKIEVFYFFKMIYKFVLFLNILLILFVKGIFMYINFYSFINKFGNSFFFYKFILILILCCYFMLFHLYIHEYKNLAY